jgi:hypothetical protein
MLGVPLRFIVIGKTIVQQGVELNAREAGETRMVPMDEVAKLIWPLNRGTSCSLCPP